MDKLTLEHLAPYLPYGLKVKHEAWQEIIEMDAVGDKEKLSIMDVPKYATPLLRPLSDLNKEINHGHIVFRPLERLTSIFGGRQLKFEGKAFYQTIEESKVRGKKHDEVPMHFSQYDAFKKLFQWHFDVFGLIEAGLAEVSGSHPEDQPGNKLVLAIGYSDEEKTHEIATKYQCDKSDCRCIGTWVNGNEDEVISWRYLH